MRHIVDDRQCGAVFYVVVFGQRERQGVSPVKHLILEPLKALLLIRSRLPMHDLEFTFEVFLIVGERLQNESRRIPGADFEDGLRTDKTDQAIEEGTGKLNPHRPIAVERLNRIEELLVDAHHLKSYPSPLGLSNRSDAKANA